MESKFAGKFRTTSARLQHWDYASAGLYFVTICTRDKEPWFGEIKERAVVLSDAGGLVNNFWSEIPDHFANVFLDEFVVMPDHVHGIVGIGDGVEVGDECKNVGGERRDVGGECRDVAMQRLYNDSRDNQNNQRKFMAKISPKPGSLSTIVRSFKSICTREIRKIQPTFSWQPRFYDRIIRNETELERIRRYICKNPGRWDPASEELEWGSWYKGELWV